MVGCRDGREGILLLCVECVGGVRLWKVGRRTWCESGRRWLGGKALCRVGER